MQFKPGAFIPAAPVQPVLIRYYLPQHMVNTLLLYSLDLYSSGHSDLDMGSAIWCSHMYISFPLSVEPKVKLNSSLEVTHNHIHEKPFSALN